LPEKPYLVEGNYIPYLYPMPSINGENIAPGPGQGAAFILPNNNPNAIALHMAGQRAREAAKARQAQANQKAADDHFKEWNAESSQILKADTGPTYQSYVMDEGQKVHAQLIEAYKNKDLNPFDRESTIRPPMLALAKQAQRGKQIDENLAKIRATYGNDAEINQEQYWRDVHASQYQKDEHGNPLVGKVIAPLDYDLTTPERLLTDRKYLNVPTLYGNFAKQLAPAENTQQAVGGRPGTMATSSTDKVRFWKRNPDGSLYHNPKSGERQIEVTDALLEHALGNERIKRDLQGMMADHTTLEASAKQKMERLEQLTPDERHALDVDPTMKDLLGRRLTQLALADHQETQRYVAKPQPRVSAAPTGQLVQFNENDVRPAQVGATVNPRSQFENFFDFGPAVQQNFYTSRHSGAPTILQKNGTRKPVQADALYSREVLQEDGRGNLTRTTNNKTPMSGYYGEAHQLPVNPQTGEVALPKNKEDEAALLAKGYKPQTFVAFYTDKNENFTGDYRKALTELAVANNREYDDQKKSPAELEDAARKMASKGVARKFIPYDANNAATINNQAGTYYRDFHRGTMKARTAPKEKADPLGFGTPKQTGVSWGEKARAILHPSFLKPKPHTFKPNTGGLY
jgi:hypothetical protein